METLLAPLNPRQREAVTAPLGNILVLAGAGSGKTRVLVNRIAWLIQTQEISPHSVLAVTFTNKAAGEMRARVEQLLHTPMQHMWVGTFHSLAHRLLRMHWEQANLPQSFQIIDSDDQHRLIKRLLKTLNLDEDQWQPRKVQWFINGKKEEGLRSQHIEPHADVYLETMIRIYRAYEDACERAGLVDFSELLLRAHELWRQNPILLQHYQQRFQYILVDEFQDINTIQYAWIKLLASNGNPVMVVGDDDQSIYGWRGAKIENIHKFSQDFAATTTIRLEQNYRSTQVILDAANALIENNPDRLGKKLWSEGEQGEPISIYAAFNELDEAHFIAGQINNWLEQHTSKHADIAILYRSNAQSRVLEEALIHKSIPYRVYGGLRFYERAEIKDTLAYLRLIANRNDDAAFERVINHPARGIGDRTLSHLRELAREHNIALWQALQKSSEIQDLSARAINCLQAFAELIESLASDTQEFDLAQQTEHAIRQSGLWAHYNQEKGEKARARLENLEELISATSQFQPDPSEAAPLLSAFLAHAALEAGEAQGDAHQDCVQLMTLHAAKGLEFQLVFIAGMEEGLFPHQLSIEDPARLQEERRLCYVGMTRAMQKLYFTYAEVRRMYGREHYHRSSRFINEVPSELLNEVRLRGAGYPMKPTEKITVQTADDSPYPLGQTVKHPKFGDGVILNYEGSGEHARVQVKFKQHGVKWLVLAYANLQTAKTGS
ncbi:MAG: DNA helicase II [Gammaproteobacteria bacterium]